MNLFDELKWRGLVYDATDGLAEAFATERVTAYIGFDPTASSLHIGNLLRSDDAGAAAALRPLADRDCRRRHRHDRRSERQVAGARAAHARADRRPTSTASSRSWRSFSTSSAPDNPARVVNNADWLATFDLLGFLRDTGKYFTVNYMLQKESVNRRLESEDGISYTEFSYLLLQARDFLELFDRYGCTLQMGGSDQWGNITAGIELIRKVRAQEGARPGDAAGDDGVGCEVRQDRSGHHLARCRAHSRSGVPSVLVEHRRSRRDRLSEVLHVPRRASEIDDLETAGDARAGKARGAAVLAEQVTTLVHGAEEATRAQASSAVLFTASMSNVTAQTRRVSPTRAGDRRRCAVDVDCRRASSTATG